MKSQIGSKQSTVLQLRCQDISLIGDDGNLALEFVSWPDEGRDLSHVWVQLDVLQAEKLVIMLTDHLAALTALPSQPQTPDTHPINWEEYEGRIPADQLENLKQFIGAFEPAPGFTLERLLAEEVYYPEGIF